MKKIRNIRILFLIVFSIANLRAGATTFYWIATSTANWNTSSNWSTLGPTGLNNVVVTPGSGDVATFTSSRTGSCAINTSINVAGFTIQSGYTGTITQNSGSKIVIGTSNASLSAGTFTGGRDSITVNGTFTLSGTTFTSTSDYLILNNTVTNSSGTFAHHNGKVSFSSSSGQTIPAWNFYDLISTSSGARTLAASGTIGVANAFTIGSNSYTNTSSTIDFNGTGSETVPAFNYNNLTISGARTSNSVTLASSGTVGVAGAFSATATYTTGAYIITGNLINYNANSAQTVSAFNYNDLTISGTHTGNNVTLVNGGIIGIAGTFTNSASFSSGGAIVTTGNSIDFNGGVQNIPLFTFYILSIDGSGDKTATGNITVNSELSIHSGRILNMGTNTLGGTLTFTGFSGTIQTQNTGSTPIPTGITWAPAVAYNSASAQTIVNGKYGSLDGTGGNRTLSSTDTVHISGTFTVGGGTYTVTSSTVDFNGSTQNIPTFTFNNMVVRGSGDKTATGNLTVNGSLNVNSGRILNMGTNTLNGTLGSTSGSGTIQTQNTGSTPIATSKTWAPAVAYNSASAQTIVNGKYGNLDGTGGNRTLSSTDTVHISGTFTVGSGTYTVTSSTVDFNGGTQNIPTFTFNNMAVRGSGDKTATGNLTVNGTLNVNSGRILNMGTNTLGGTLGTISGSGTIQTQNTGSTPIATGKTWAPAVAYNSASAQTIVNGKYGSLDGTGGNRTLSSTDTVHVSGTFTAGSGTYTVTSSTVDFNGGTQNIPAATFNNMAVRGSGDKTATGNLTVNGILNVNSSRSLNMGTNALGGLFTTSGSGTILTQNTGSSPLSAGRTWAPTVAYNSTSAQTIVNGKYSTLNGNNGDRTLSATDTVHISGTFALGLGTYTVTGSTVDFNGATQNIPGFTFNNMVASGTGDKTATSNLVVNGILTVNNGRILNMGVRTLSGTLSSTSGTGTIQTQNTSSTPLATGKTWAPAVAYNSASAQTIVNGKYGNLDGTGGNRTLSSTDTVHISGTFTLGSGTYTVTSSTVDFNGGTQNIPAFTFNNMIAGGSGDKTATGNLTVNGILTVNNNVLEMGTNTLGGTLSSTGGNGRIETLNTGSSPLAAGKTWIPKVIYSSASAQTIVYGKYGNLNASGGNRTLSSTDTVHISGPFTAGSGTYTVTSSTVDFNGSTQTIPAFTFNNLRITGSGKTASGALTVNGILAIGSGGDLDMATNQLLGTISSTSGTGIIHTQNTASLPVPSGKTWSMDVDYNGAVQTAVTGTYNNLKITGTNNKTASGTLTVNSTLTINSGLTLDMVTNALAGSLTSSSGSGSILKTQNTSSTPIPASKTWPFTVYYSSTSSQTIVIGNYVDLDGTGGNRVLSNTGVIGVAGAFTPGAGIYTAAGSTMNFNGTTAQTIPAFAFANLTISGAHTSSNVTLASSGTTLVDNNMAVNATFTSGGFVTTGSHLVFDGSINQYLNGSSTAYFGKLEVDKSAGKVLLQQPAMVNDQLMLARKGIIGSSATNYIQVNGADTVLGGSDSSYVCGPVKKKGNQAFTFPLGDTTLISGGYHPLHISAPSVSTDVFTATYFATGQTSGTALQPDSIETISDCEYWLLARNTGTSVVVPSLYWNTNSCNIDDYDYLRVAGWNGSQWQLMGNGGVVIDSSRGKLSASIGLSASSLPLLIANSSSELVDITTPTTDAGSNQSICPGTSAQLTATGADLYSWYPQAGLNNTMISNPVASPDTTTQYYVIGTNGNTSVIDSVIITVRASPSLTVADSVMKICPGGSASLSVSGSGTFLWQPSYALSDSTSSTPTSTPDSTVNYVVTLTDTHGCTAQRLVGVEVTNVLLDAPDTVTMDRGDSVQLYALSNATELLWTPSAYVSDSASSSPYAISDTIRTYTVTAMLDSCTTSATVLLNVLNEPLAGFTYTFPGLTVSFETSNIGPATYAWDFGDTNTSTSAAPSHTYSSAGVYTVCLTVTNERGTVTQCNDVDVE